MTKILVIRFSSIGDIVLTSPILRCIKSQLKEVELHALTKAQYVSLFSSNPNVDKVHAWSDNNAELFKTLKRERFDYIVDLHKNLRSRRVIATLRRRSFSFPKLNFEKWVLVNFKKDILPKIHIVDRYFHAVRKWGIKNDEKGLDFYIAIDQEAFRKKFTLSEKYIVVAIGGQFATKKTPPEKLSEILGGLTPTIVLIGGKEDFEEGKTITTLLKGQKVINTCGEFSIHESAQIIKNGAVLVTNDTGMMHIGAAFDLPIVSIWGNTVPEFGMYPYRPQAPESYSIHEVKNLPCRPCSKIGYAKCPKGHFKCMLDQNTKAIQQQIRTFLRES